jgi:hypothetical protein
LEEENRYEEPDQLRHIGAFNRQNFHRASGPPTFETPVYKKKSYNLQIEASDDNSMLEDYDIEEDLDNDLQIGFDEQFPQKIPSGYHKD